MIVGIVGSRDYPDIPAVRRFVRSLAAKYPEAIVVSGGARGVDREAELEAKLRGLDVLSYRPYEYENMLSLKEWSIETHYHGERALALMVEKSRAIRTPYFRTFAQAAFHRNGWIVEDCEQLAAFWNGASTGTADTLRRAATAGRPAHVFRG